MIDNPPFPGEPSRWAKFWSLDPTVTFLNHGSYGACPLPVLESQQRWRSQMEREPLRFFMREFEDLLDAARTQLATFVGAQADDLAFVPNATTGVNAVLRSLPFTSSDELLTTNHEYNACRNALEFIASRTGAKVVVVTIPFPLESSDQIVEAVLRRVSRKTRLALLDHVTSKTGLIFPIQQLVSELAARGVDTLVDGAHAPGMVPLNLEKMGVAYYTGNCHKWLCTPKGAGFLYVRRDRQSAIRPLTISHGANSRRTDKSRFHLEFDWMGTDDPTAYLCVPEAIRFLGSLLPGGWLELMEHNRAKALFARKVLCEALGVSPPCPEEMVGAMAVVPLPEALSLDEETGRSRLAVPFDTQTSDFAKQRSQEWPILQDMLFERFKIEVPIIPWSDPFNQILRVSAQLYNTPDEYYALAQALVTLRSNLPN